MKMQHPKLTLGRNGRVIPFVQVTLGFVLLLTLFSLVSNLAMLQSTTSYTTLGPGRSTDVAGAVGEGWDVENDRGGIGDDVGSRNARSRYGYRYPRPPFAPVVHVSHNCTISETSIYPLPGKNKVPAREVHLPVALPHLILIGAQKGGTSSLQEILKLRPEVVTPLRRGEPHFFDEKVVMKAPGGWLDETNEGDLCRLRKRYAHYFKMEQFLSYPKNQMPIAFEKTPSYMMHPTIPRAIDAVCTWKPRILATLRNPATRAFSQYQMDVEYVHKNASFEQIVEQEVEQLVERGLLKEGTLSLSEYEQRRDEFDFSKGTLSPILTHNVTLEEYAKLASGFLSPTEKRRLNFKLFRGLYALLLFPWVEQFGPEDRMMVIRFEEFAEQEKQGRTDIEDNILLFAGIKDLRDQNHKRRPVQKNKASGSAVMNPITKDYLKWLYQPFNDLLPELLGEEWRGVWDEW